MFVKTRILPLLLIACLSLLSIGFIPASDAETPHLPANPQPIITPDPIEEVALLFEIAETIELTHEQLLRKQELLQELGWYEGGVDGIKGPLTEAAIELFADAADIDDTSQEPLLEALEDPEAPEAPPPPPPPAPAPSPPSSAETQTTPAPSSPSNSESPSEPGRYGVGEPWATLAECESGNWIDGGTSFEKGSARWYWGGRDPIPPWGTSIHDGGLQFHPDTWRWVAGDMGLLSQYQRAYHAPPAVQVEVARELQRRQGWGAWPVCSRKVGLR